MIETMLCIRIITIDYKFIVLLVLELSGGDENNLNNSIVIWPKVEINRVFFVLEIFSYIEF